jgi:hypothetical protein
LEKTIQVELHSRVDTTNKDVRDIVVLWTNYLNARPDSISDSPYWNTTEKKKYTDFDHSRTLLYQFPAAQLLSYFKPKMLSVEKEGPHYAIRTMYLSEHTTSSTDNSNPWAIQKLYAVKEANEWKLKNALPVITEKWNRTTVGKITFIYPPDHSFRKDLAMKADDFCTQLSKQYQFNDWLPFDFYLTHSGDELGKLLNFDFFFAGYTTGIAFHSKRMLLSGAGSEYYPHEFVHMVVPQSERHSMLEEGFATWKGGQGQKTFKESASVLAAELKKNPSIRFNDVLNKQWGWEYAAFYTTGAILCHAADEQGGIALVKQLLQIKGSDEILVNQLCQLFRIDKNNLDDFWRKETLKFLDR